MGAKIIEKHFTLDTKRKGFDHKISLEPKQFLQMVKKIRENEIISGIPNFKVFNKDNDFKKIRKIIRGYKLVKNVKKIIFLNKSDFSTIRMSNPSKLTKI